ncbi:MAG: hypothetical protein KC416_17010 [Myxococcales bacterium]|nr:hypothetical protein [Myxococcales bacterium]
MNRPKPRHVEGQDAHQEDERQVGHGHHKGDGKAKGICGRPHGGGDKKKVSAPAEHAQQKPTGWNITPGQED